MVNNFIQRYCDGLAGKVTGFCTIQGTSKKSKVHLYQLKTIEVFASPLAQSFANLPGLCNILLHVQYNDAVDDCVVGQVQEVHCLNAAKWIRMDLLYQVQALVDTFRFHSYTMSSTCVHV